MSRSSRRLGTHHKWTPANLGSSVYFWMDISNLSTLTMSAGNITQILDLSKYGNNLSNTIGTIAFSSNGMNGLPTAISAGGARLLGGRNLSPLPAHFSAFAVASGSSRGVFQSIFDIDDRIVGTHTMGVIALIGQNGNVIGNYTYDTGGVFYESPELSITPNVPQIFELDRKPNQIGIALNGGAISYNSTSNTDETQGSTIIIFSDQGTSDYFVGNISEIILTSQLNSTQFAIMEGYLAWKWQMTNVLPASHPYRLQAP